MERVEGSDLAYSAAFFMQKLPVRDLTRFFSRRCAAGAVVDGVRYRFTDVLRPFQQQFGALMGPYVGPGFRIRVYGYAWSDYLMWTFDATNAVGAAGPVISHAYFSLDGEA